MAPKSGVRKVCGIGINNSKEPTIIIHNKKVVWKCPYYVKWVSMLHRCYKNTYKNPTYSGCTVCEEWLTFSNFKSWMETQDWEGKDLDKDLLVYQNKVYSPETCCFVNKEINNFITLHSNKRGDFPLGVYYNSNKNKIVGQCANGDGVSEYLGYYETPEEAHKAWQEAKIERGEILKLKQTNSLISQGLTRVINKLKYDLENNLETTDL